MNTQLLAQRIPGSSVISLTMVPHVVPEVVASYKRKTIKVVEEIEPAALNFSDSAKYMGVGTWQFWRLRHLPESDPRKVHCTGYETVSVAELDRALQAATDLGKPLPRIKRRKK